MRILNDLKLSKYTTFSVLVLDDYNIEGSFDPDAASDIDYYGYRETCWEIIEAQGHDSLGSWVMNQYELNTLMKIHEGAMTLIIQNKLDEKGI